MYCRNCGNEIKEGVSFCGMCGTPVTSSAVQQTVSSEAPQTYVNRNGNMQPMINNENNGKNNKKLTVVIILSIAVVLAVIAIVVAIVFIPKSTKNSGSGNKNIEDTNGISKEGKKLLESMMGEWEATLSGGFFGSHYYQPHYDLIIDSDFIYVTDGVVFNHDINEVQYIEENGVKYIVFEDEIFHRETRSTVEIIKTTETMPIRIFFIEDGKKLAFEINPDGKEWKLIAEYKRVGSYESNNDSSNDNKSTEEYIELGETFMEVIVQSILLKYSSLEEFDKAIENEYNGSIKIAIQNVLGLDATSADDSAEDLYKLLDEYYVEAISYYEQNGRFEEQTMINLGKEIAELEAASN